MDPYFHPIYNSGYFPLSRVYYEDRFPSREYVDPRVIYPRPLLSYDYQPYYSRNYYPSRYERDISPVLYRSSIIDPEPY